MTRTPRLYILDILESIKKILKYTADLKFEQFLENSLVKDEVSRNFEIIGEAAAHTPQDIQNRYSQIPWHKMKAMRNIMTHEYFRVDFSIIWETAHQDLPDLLPQIEQALADIDKYSERY